MQFKRVSASLERLRQTAYPGIIGLFTGWRLGLFLLFYLAIAVLASTQRVMPASRVADAHFWWDGYQFLNIAYRGYPGAVTFNYTYFIQHGYAASLAADQSIVVVGFFPLYPLCIKLLSFITLGKIRVAAIGANMLLTPAFLIYLYRLLRLDFDDETSFRTIFFILVFPTAFFLAVNYSEPLFMLTLTASIYYARKGNWPVAGIAGMLCAASRHLGILLLPILAWEYLRQRDWDFKQLGTEAVSLVLVPLGAFFYMAYLWSVYGDPLYFFESHRRSFGHQVNLRFWEPVVNAFRDISSRGIMDAHSAIVTLNLLVLALFVVLFIWGLKRLPSTYSVITGIFLLAILMTDTPQFPLVSLDRYVLPLFPAFLLLAQWGRNRSFRYAYVAVAAMLMGAQALIFSLEHYFIA
ncbi:MAG: hypothetical protein ACYC55_06850 [Candidatus Geothermincolia bacterium]